MPFIESILKYGSLSVVGMEKNTGKTETLNYILRRLPKEVAIAVTSVGTDGELRDMVTGTPKPEITLRQGTIFSTAEKYYSGRRLTSELLNVGVESTAAGRIVTARALTNGKVMLSGPSSTVALQRWMNVPRSWGADLVIIDGALSRRSSASPVLSEAMVLTTGAAFSADMKRLMRETAHTVSLMKLPLASDALREKFAGLGKGIWSLTTNGELIPLEPNSSLGGKLPDAQTLSSSVAIYVGGALTERLLGALRTSRCVPEVVVEDFTKIFVSPTAFGAWSGQAGRISVIRRSELVAITVNPYSPNGVVLDSAALVEMIGNATGVPVYDVRML